MLPQIRFGHRVQDVHFRTEQTNQLGLPFLHFTALGADGKQFAEHFREREQRDEPRIVLGHDRGLAVGQRHDPVEHADRERLAAYRADDPSVPYDKFTTSYIRLQTFSPPFCVICKRIYLTPRQKRIERLFFFRLRLRLLGRFFSVSF